METYNHFSQFVNNPSTYEHGIVSLNDRMNLFLAQQNTNWLNVPLVNMDEEQEERKKKRTRDHPSTFNAQRAECSLEFSLKKVRISKQVPGQLRLQQDVNECNFRGRLQGLDLLKMDAKHPLTALVRLSNGKEFSVVVGRFYPHQAPEIFSHPHGERLTLPVLKSWLPVYTLHDVLVQMIAGQTMPHDSQMEEDFSD